MTKILILTLAYSLLFHYTSPGQTREVVQEHRTFKQVQGYDLEVHIFAAEGVLERTDRFLSDRGWITR